MYKFITPLIALALLTSCDDAKVASRNLSKAAGNFEINRRIVFYNSITGEYILNIEGRCSIEGGRGTQLAVICKTGPEAYKKHFLGLSDNVTFFAEQLKAADVSIYHYRVVFKPQVIIPEIDLRTSGKELLKDRE